MIDTETESERRHRALSQVRATMTVVPDAREGVSVSVRRRSGFQNDAVTPTGRRLLVDEPYDFGGCGEAPDPAELLLAAVGASLSVTITAHAALMDVRIDAVELALSAEIEAAPFFNPDAGGSPGLLDVSIILTIMSTDDEARVRSVVDRAWRAAPVLRTLNAEPSLKFDIRQAAV